MKVRVAGQRVIATAEGNGPVHALDAALREALRPHLSWMDSVGLADYKVRILTNSHGTDAVTRVLVEIHRRGAGVDHGRRARQHRRGQLAGHV